MSVNKWLIGIKGLRSNDTFFEAEKYIHAHCSPMIIANGFG